MKTNVTVIVVDDLPMYARTIENVLVERNKNSDTIEYVPFVFCADTHFNDASQFINNELSLASCYKVKRFN